MEGLRPSTPSAYACIAPVVHFALLRFFFGTLQKGDFVSYAKPTGFACSLGSVKSYAQIGLQSCFE